MAQSEPGAAASPAARGSRLVWGVILLGVGGLWLMSAAGYTQYRNLPWFLGVAVLAGIAALFYAGARGGSGSRSWMLVAAGIFASFSVLVLGDGLGVLPHALTPLVFFAGPAAAFARLYQLDRGRGWALLLAWLCGVIGVTAVVGALDILGGNLAGAVFLWGCGAAFLWYFLATGRDWAILPGGLLAAMGILPLADGVSLLEDIAPALFFFGAALAFGALYLLGRPRSSEWARIPAVGLAALGLLALVGALAGPFVAYGVPLALIGLGVWLIVGRKNGGAPSPSA